MATTNFTTGTVITSKFLNDVQDAKHLSYTPAGTGAVATTVQEKLSEHVSPLDFGAIGDGITDDKAAVKAAMESGYPVDGCGLTYAINGTCQPTSFKGLVNANFIQIGDNSATNVQAIRIVGISDFFIRDVQINMGSNITTLFADDNNSGLYIGGVDKVTFIDNFSISNVSVTGNGCGAGIQIRYAKNFSVDNCRVYDRVSGSIPDPVNDSQNGFCFAKCHKFTVNNCVASNLQTRLAGVATVKWTRGFLFFDAVDCTITGCISELNDQAYDFSGGYVPADGYYGNRQFVISGCTANNAGTFGFKFANVTHNGLVSGCIASNIGSIGFIFSPAMTIASGAEKYLTQNIDVVGCKAVNMLGTGSSGSNATGFRCMAGETFTSYPRGIRFKNCHVEDNQDVITTTAGFASDVILPTYNEADYNKPISNYVQGCSVGVGITTEFSGISPIYANITGSSTQSFNNNTLTEVLWNTTISDNQSLHNPSTNSQYIYIKESGWYKIIAQLNFAANTTGYRFVRLTKNGAAIDRSSIYVIPVPDAPASVATETTIYLKSGDAIAVVALQNSGGVLNLLTNESYFSIIGLR